MATPIVCGPAGTFRRKSVALLPGLMRAPSSVISRATGPPPAPTPSPALRARTLERIFGVERKSVLKENAAACTERQSFRLGRLREVARHAPGFRGRRGRGIAHGEAADLGRRGDVAFQQRGRNTQGGGDVVEAFARIIRGQQRGYIDVDAKQIANRIAVFGAIQAVQTDIAGIWVQRGAFIERRFEVAGEFVDRRTLRTRR